MKRCQTLQHHHWRPQKVGEDHRIDPRRLPQLAASLCACACRPLIHLRTPGSPYIAPIALSDSDSAGTDGPALPSPTPSGEVAAEKVDLNDKDQMALAMAYASGTAKPMVRTLQLPSFYASLLPAHSLQPVQGHGAGRGFLMHFNGVDQ